MIKLPGGTRSGQAFLGLYRTRHREDGLAGETAQPDGDQFVHGRLKLGDSGCCTHQTNAVEHSFYYTRVADNFKRFPHIG